MHIKIMTSKNTDLATDIVLASAKEDICLSVAGLF